MASGTPFEVAHLVRSCRETGGDDRLAVIPCSAGVALVVADGAGGTGNGALAAECLVAFLRDAIEADAMLDVVGALQRADQVVLQKAEGGQTTCVVAMISSERIWGAAVGDSEAWLVDGQVDRLTADQHRKPLLGTGEAVVVPFGTPSRSGTLVVGTDGLFKYTSAAKITQVLHGRVLGDLPGELIELVRLRNGQLQDDVAVIVATLRGR